MALTIRAELERGQELDSMVDESNALFEMEGRLGPNAMQLIRFVDPYGDTVFNSLQFDVVEADLNLLEGVARSTVEKQLIDGLRRLLGTCRERVHTYLKFVGD